MTEVAGHASSVGDSPDHVRLSRIEVDTEAGAPGEAPDRRHPSTHRLCGGKQIQHLPETTAGAPAIVKGLLAHLGRLVEHEGRGLVAKALGSRFWGHTTLPVGPSRKPGPTERAPASSDAHTAKLGPQCRGAGDLP